MERAIVGSLRGIVCTLAFAGLAACNFDDSGSGVSGPAGTDQMQGPGTVGHSPSVSNPVEPETPPAPPKETPADPPSETPDDSDPDPVTPPLSTNSAPQIGGSPSGEVVAGQSFSFQPSASDADGDALTFSIQGKPSWASFNAGNGRLSGTPAQADVGSHEQIVISVSDGGATRSLPQFVINVVAQTNGSATLAWEPPTQNTDGSPLTNLKGYKIHYGTTSGAYETTVTINNAGLTSYVIENLAPGTYFFAISAVATNGLESDLSTEASKTI
jgi:hypothetical protein